jgi:hypothetical protein
MRAEGRDHLLRLAADETSCHGHIEMTHAYFERFILFRKFQDFFDRRLILTMLGKNVVDSSA